MSEPPQDDTPQVAYFACEPLEFIKPEALPQLQAQGYTVHRCDECEREIAVGPKQMARYTAPPPSPGPQWVVPRFLLCYLCVLKVKSPDATVINLNKGTET